MYLHVHKAPLGPEPFFRHPMGMDERPTSDFVTALLVNLTLNRSNGVRLRDPILGYGYRHLSFVDNGHAAATRSFGSSPYSKMSANPHTNGIRVFFDCGEEAKRRYAGGRNGKCA